MGPAVSGPWLGARALSLHLGDEAAGPLASYRGGGVLRSSSVRRAQPMPNTWGFTLETEAGFSMKRSKADSFPETRNRTVCFLGHIILRPRLGFLA